MTDVRCSVYGCHRNTHAQTLCWTHYDRKRRTGSVYGAPDPDDGLVSSMLVCARAAITYRQLDYWIRTGAIPLAELRGLGSGKRRRFTVDETAKICAVAAEYREVHERLDALRSGQFWSTLGVQHDMEEAS